MKKQVVIILMLGFVSTLLSSCGYNTMVQMDETVRSQWSNVENQYQRRADLIPNLVNTVKGYAAHEQETFTQVTEARSRATSIQINADELTPEHIQRFQEAQSQLSGALSRLLAVAENYPQLKANQNFLELQAQLEGTENRIAVERRRFNEVTGEYNSYVRSFPRVLYAGMFGFKPKPYFEAQEGTEQAPRVEF